MAVETAKPVQRDAWRGVAAEDVDELPADVSALLRRRSRRLLGRLVAPYRWRLLAAVGLITLPTGGALCIPCLVAPLLGRGSGRGNAGLPAVYVGCSGGAAV